MYKEMKSKRDIAIGVEQMNKGLSTSPQPQGYSPTKVRGSNKVGISNPRMSSTLLGGSGVSKSRITVPGNFLVNPDIGTPMSKEKGSIKGGKLTMGGALKGIGMWMYMLQQDILPREAARVDKAIVRHFEGGDGAGVGGK